jgi:hypothetical protein
MVKEREAKIESEARAQLAKEKAEIVKQKIEKEARERAELEKARRLEQEVKQKIRTEELVRKS